MKCIPICNIFDALMYVDSKIRLINSLWLTVTLKKVSSNPFSENLHFPWEKHPSASPDCPELWQYCLSSIALAVVPAINIVVAVVSTINIVLAVVSAINMVLTHFGTFACY